MKKTKRLEIYVREYLAVAGYLKKKVPPEPGQQCLWVDKTELCAMLNRNAYEPAIHKLKVWRDLRWIQTEPGRLTRRVTRDGRVAAMVKIDLVAYAALAEIARSDDHS